jgi:parallel beta-helix repeat protein
LEITSDDSIEEGIEISSVSRSFIIQNCIINVISYGISISYVDYQNVIIRNNICNEGRSGMYLRSLENSRIENNTCSLNGEYGIYLQGSSNITLRNNTIFDNEIGIEIYSSDNCDITNNLFFNNEKGLFFEMSRQLVINSNRFHNDGIEFPTWFWDETYDLKHFTIENNLVNDLPLGFFHDLTNQTFSEDYGQLLLLRCNDSLISSVSISNTYAGIVLISCRNLELKEITISYNYHGLRLEDSGECFIHNCTFQNNLHYGLDLSYGSISNKIYLNQFIDNSILTYQRQARDEGEENVWYDRKTKSGNYWSDLSSLYCYYTLDGRARSVDYYPLNRADTCPDFFLQRRLKISLPLIIIPLALISLFYFVYIPLRRKSLEKFNKIDMTFLCPECGIKLLYSVESCSNCSKTITKEYLEKGKILSDYPRYDSACIKERNKFFVSLSIAIITSMIFGPLSFLICPIIFGPIWVLSSGISLIFAFFSLFSWILSVNERNLILKSYSERVD